MGKIDKDLLFSLCKHILDLSGIPILIYKDQKEFKRLEQIPSPFHLESICIDDFFQTDQNLTYLLTPEFLLFGYLRFDDMYSLLLGPVTIMSSYPEDLTRQFAFNYPGIISHITDIEHLQNYLSSLPNDISFSNFINILSVLWISVMQEPIEKDAIVPIVSEAFPPIEREKALLHEEHQKNVNEYVNALNEDYEKKLLYLIEHGNAQEMKYYLHSYNIEIWKMGNTPLRQAKNAAIVLNSIALRAAIRGHLPASTAYSLGSVNLQKIEASSSASSLNQLCSDMIYDYCSRVHHIQTLTTSDKKINEILLYINEHIHEKISVSTIASHFSISREYLSRHFHKITGQTLANYINMQKVYESKRLLALTDLPITEISEYLSFSSQSYFQTVFKKYERTTPQLYRNSFQQSN